MSLWEGMELQCQKKEKLKTYNYVVLKEQQVFTDL